MSEDEINLLNFNKRSAMKTSMKEDQNNFI